MTADGWLIPASFPPVCNVATVDVSGYTIGTLYRCPCGDWYRLAAGPGGTHVLVIDAQATDATIAQEIARAAQSKQINDALLNSINASLAALR